MVAQRHPLEIMELFQIMGYVEGGVRVWDIGVFQWELVL